MLRDYCTCSRELQLLISHKLHLGLSYIYILTIVIYFSVNRRWVMGRELNHTVYIQLQCYQTTTHKLLDSRTLLARRGLLFSFLTVYNNFSLDFWPLDGTTHWNWTFRFITRKSCSQGAHTECSFLASVRYLARWGCQTGSNRLLQQHRWIKANLIHTCS